MNEHWLGDYWIFDMCIIDCAVCSWLSLLIPVYYQTVKAGQSTDSRSIEFVHEEDCTSHGAARLSF